MSHTPDFGPVMIDLEGLTLTKVEIEKIQHPNTGAIILFTRNYQNPKQLIALIDHIRKIRNAGLLIAVDQEGGRVQRFRNQFTKLPPADFYAQQSQAELLAENCGWLMATELLSVGVDFSFAPVLDVDCGISEVIGNRSFSSDPLTVAALANHFRQGMQFAGMAAVGKHFPGHGAVTADSHLDLPIDERSMDCIKKKDLIPFQQLIRRGLQGIMPAHVVYADVDPLPAGFSPFWIKTVLRRELGFDGAVFSDDLNMEGAAFAGDYLQRTQTALSAGCDMALLCNNPVAAEQVLERLPIKKNPLRNRRLLAMQAKKQWDRVALFASNEWQKRTNNLSQLFSTAT